jgi:hypothetical protein
MDMGCVVYEVGTKFLVNKTNRCTEFQFLLVIITLHVSGSLSAHHQELLSRATPFRPDPGSTRSPSCINCTSAVARLRSF